MPLSADEPKSVSIETIGSIQRAIVPIVCTQVDEKNEWQIKRIIGTGFLINREGYFLTAGHVVLEWEKISAAFGPCFPAVYIPKTPWGERNRKAVAQVRWSRFDECKYESGADVAVCKLLENPFTNPIISKNVTPLKLGSIVNHADGSPVAFTGFPLGFHVPVTSKGYIAAYSGGDKKLLIDKSAWPGASGSPVYDADGKVIGLLIATGLAEGAGLTYAEPADVVLEFLSKEKIAFEK